MPALSCNVCLAIVLATSLGSLSATRDLHEVQRLRPHTVVGEHQAPTAVSSAEPITEIPLPPVIKPAKVAGGWSWEAFGKAFGVIALAELFDQTWFLCLVLALRFGWKSSFIGGFAALSFHTVICALLGYEISKHILASTLQLVTACLFSVFAMFWAREAYLADTGGNFLADSIAEAEEECDELCEDAAETGSLVAGSNKTDYTKMSDPSISAAQGLLTSATASQSSAFWASCKNAAKCFGFLLIGEMGDKTQFAMISLQGTLPWIPVLVGCEVAFAMLCLSATLCAEIVKGQSINQRYVLACVSATFVVFAILALNDGIELRALGQ